MLLFWYLMNMKKGLFDKDKLKSSEPLIGGDSEEIVLKRFGEKITRFIEWAKELKDENQRLVKRLEELEDIVKRQAKEIDALKEERLYLKKEIVEILHEIEEIEL